MVNGRCLEWRIRAIFVRSESARFLSLDTVVNRKAHVVSRIDFIARVFTTKKTGSSGLELTFECSNSAFTKAVQLWYSHQ
jgi:hypothetical protein